MPARLAASRIDDMDILVLTLAASATALATGLGAVPVFFMGTRAEAVRPTLLGVSIGAMTVASLLGLLKPALEEGSSGVGGARARRGPAPAHRRQGPPRRTRRPRGRAPRQQRDPLGARLR